jgi:hypothetical protein
MMLDITDFRMGAGNDKKLSPKLRVGVPSGKTFLHELLVQVLDAATDNGTFAGADITTLTDAVAIMADSTKFDKIVAKI